MIQTNQIPGLYDPSFEHDNCGIGACVNIKGVKNHQTVDNALKIVETLEHRAGKDAAGETGDGVGIMLQISHKDVYKRQSMTVPDGVDYEAMDGEPSDVFFMIAAPAEGSDVHLEALSRLSVILMDPVFKDSILKATSKEEYLRCV